MTRKWSNLMLQSSRINTARTRGEVPPLCIGDTSRFLTPRRENLFVTLSPRLYPAILAHYMMKFIQANESHFSCHYRGLIPGMGKTNFSSAQRPGGSGAHPAPHWMETEDSSPCVKQAGLETNHWPHPMAEIKNEWRYKSTSPYTTAIYTDKCFLSYCLF